jgi:hypothetical protein
MGRFKIHSALMGGLVLRVHYTEHMNFEFEMVSIPREQLDHLLTMMRLSESYCRKARPLSWPQSQEDIYAEPTEFYSGASGYAGATLREAIQTIESNLPVN